MKNDELQESQMQPIQDTAPSPTGAIQTKRNSLTGEEGATQVQHPPVYGKEENRETDVTTAMFRNHQVNYSFGQPPLKEMQHNSTRFGANTGPQNSLR